MAETMSEAATGRRNRRVDGRAASLPPILTLSEFVAEMERDYGNRVELKALKAAIRETEPNE
jgi:hypothetical protein